MLLDDTQPSDLVHEVQYQQTQRVPHLKEKVMDYKRIFKTMFPLGEFPRVRSTDPVTSFEAAEAIKPVVSEHHRIILECLQEYGALGKDGIAGLTNLDGNQVARRLNEMKVIGLIELTGKMVRSNSGRNEREWQCLTQQ